MRPDVVTFEQWSKVLAILDEKSAKRYCKQLGIEGEFSTCAQLQLALVDWFSHLNIFSDGVIVEILKVFNPCIESLAESLGSEETPVFTVAICDGRWVSCSLKQEFFDAEDFEEVSELPEYAVTHIMCDVIQLYSRMHHRLTRIQHGG
jgi:hypothetical protein